ncbi:hypothetical protein PUNSTDRAFT_139009 [Punctularia strigosozonata HHB-11173 SS5]|uniref:Uncharacterized protein n=1 Tax=Punctularia strigosozonata (strain HHB-11173) TaxID=741275 RepID=R7S402_PUNST|nr:uncharacterized protein PUNSTDRAFT_139009 [Punctularia strigosozonata HHB-11173 SS5]EIN03966.1 hypothetical protein PUNSTDRAFT_139009 [Punctularia strigosozonata HHB-11173 SS5]
MGSTTVSSSAPATASPFSRRTFGRAPSPPVWACYEQIPYDEYSDESDDSEDADDHSSCSEDDENYGVQRCDGTGEVDNMDMDEAGDSAGDQSNSKDIKGKQRAVDPEPQSPPKAKKQDNKRKPRQPVFNLRPILTIQKSQGFVWNQDLFVPPYIKDRYIASTSPPNADKFLTSSLGGCEVEVVEIRVEEGELDQIIP